MDAPDKRTPVNDPKGDAPKEDLTGLYDLAIPLGMPISVIMDMVEKFDVDVVRRNAKVDMTGTAGEVVERELLVLRGDLETITEAKKYMFEALDKTVNKWDERKERYKAAYQARLEEMAEEMKNSTEDPSEIKPSDLIPPLKPGSETP
jgi:hypothetical protein